MSGHLSDRRKVFDLKDRRVGRDLRASSPSNFDGAFDSESQSRWRFAVAVGAFGEGIARSG